MSLATLFQEVENAFRPSNVRLSEKEDLFLLELVVAGVKGKDIDLSFEKKALSVVAKTGEYSYSYLVPLDGLQIDENGTPEATIEDGILKVAIPKAKASRPMKIAIKNS